MVGESIAAAAREDAGRVSFVVSVWSPSSSKSGRCLPSNGGLAAYVLVPTFAFYPSARSTSRQHVRGH